jgi:apolipoprotein N-acyltransferase
MRDVLRRPPEPSSHPEASISLRIVLLCAFSAVLYGLASPRLNWHFLCWVLLLPLLEALEGLRPRRAFLTGWMCGTMIHLVCFYWVVGTVQRYSNLDLFLSLMAWILFAIYSGVAFGFMATLFVFLRKGRSLPSILLLPACYTAMEFAFPFVFPWHLGGGLYRVVPVIQIADLGGVYGVTALCVAVNAGLWELLRFVLRRRTFPWLSFATATGLVAVTLVYGFVRIAAVEQQRKAAPGLDVGIVQANVRIEERRTSLLEDDIWRRYRRLSLQAVQQGAQLLVWPESAVHFAYHPEAGEYSPSGFLKKFVRSLDRPLLFGSWSVTSTGLRNTAYLLGPDGALEGRYDKVQLLAFGEYMPFSDWIPQLKGLVQGVGDFRPGKRIEPLCWKDFCFGVLICFEAILQPISREFVQKGAECLINITNDAWFGDTSCPEQHLMLSAFRAVENRVWLVRAANTGISAFVDPVGHILYRTAVFEQAVRVCRIERMESSSFYNKWGDWLPVSFLILLSVLTLGRVVRRFAGKDPTP